VALQPTCCVTSNTAAQKASVMVRKCPLTEICQLHSLSPTPQVTGLARLESVSVLDSVSSALRWKDLGGSCCQYLSTGKTCLTHVPRLPNDLAEPPMPLEVLYQGNVCRASHQTWQYQSLWDGSQVPTSRNPSASQLVPHTTQVTESTPRLFNVQMDGSLAGQVVGW
jgi:hypothetical protein